MNTDKVEPVAVSFVLATHKTIFDNECERFKLDLSTASIEQQQRQQPPILSSSLSVSCPSLWQMPSAGGVKEIIREVTSATI